MSTQNNNLVGINDRQIKRQKRKMAKTRNFEKQRRQLRELRTYNPKPLTTAQHETLKVEKSSNTFQLQWLKRRQ